MSDPTPRRESDDPRYLAGMSRLVEHFPSLAQSYALRARDCGRGCGCEGCRKTRGERAMAKEATA